MSKLFNELRKKMFPKSRARSAMLTTEHLKALCHHEWQPQTAGVHCFKCGVDAPLWPTFADYERWLDKQGKENNLISSIYAWGTPGGDVSRSLLWCQERCMSDGQQPFPLFRAFRESWVKCSERMPIGPEQVLICAYFPSEGEPWTEAASFQKTTEFSGYWATTQHGNLPLGNITHWMPLPESPKDRA